MLEGTRFLPHGLAQGPGPRAFLSAGYNHTGWYHPPSLMSSPIYLARSKSSVDEAGLHHSAKQDTCQTRVHCAAWDRCEDPCVDAIQKCTLDAHVPSQ